MMSAKGLCARGSQHLQKRGETCELARTSQLIWKQAPGARLIFWSTWFSEYTLRNHRTEQISTNIACCGQITLIILVT